MPITREELLAQNETIKTLTTYALDGWIGVRRELYAVEARVDAMIDGERRTLQVYGQSVPGVLAALLVEVERRQDLADEERASYREAQADRACGVRP